MILDTAFLIDLGVRDPDAVEKLAELEAEPVPQRLSAATAYELQWGVERAEQSRVERDRVEAVLDDYPVLPADGAVMREAARIGARLVTTGDPLHDIPDLVIGATARLEDDPVLTRNVDHFERMGGVAVESY